MNEEEKKTNLIKRKSIRLFGYDYSLPGGYFVTICTHKMTKLFGHVDNGKMSLSLYGCVARKEWLQTEVIFSSVEIHDDEFVIMPNHIHGIVWILEVGATEPVARKIASGPKQNSLGAIVGQYKSRVTKHINQLNKKQGNLVWQRGYYDRIIRNSKELQTIRKYIEINPLEWADKKDITLPKIF